MESKNQRLLPVVQKKQFVTLSSGRSGSGKGKLQEEFLKQFARANIPELHYKFIIISDEIKKRINSGNSDISKTIESGKLISDEQILSIMRNVLKEYSYVKYLVIDGFPRSMTQVFWLMQNVENYHLVDFDVPFEVARERSESRRVCPKCNRSYSTTFIPDMPSIDGLCDDCAVELIIREDDKPENFEVRQREYDTKIRPALDQIPSDFVTKIQGAKERYKVITKLCIMGFLPN